MKRKTITITAIITLLLLIPICFFTFKFTYRKEAIKYLEEKYNDEFNVSLIYTINPGQSGSSYEWKATSKSSPDKPFTVTREEYSIYDDTIKAQAVVHNTTHVSYHDSYPVAKFKDDIIDYYQNIADSNWTNVIAEFNCPTSLDKDYANYTKFLQDNTNSLVTLYIKYDENFNYDAQAEKILNLIENENSKNHKVYLYIYYLNDETYNKLADGTIDYLTKTYGYEECYMYSLNNDESYLNKEVIMEQMKINKSKLSSNN